MKQIPKRRIWLPPSLNLSAKSTRTLEITLNLSKKIPNVLSIRKQIERPETY